MTVQVLLVSAGIFHPPLGARLRLYRSLEQNGVFACRRLASLEALPGLDAAASGLSAAFRAIVLYVHQQKISEAALQALEGFIAGGGGLLAIHSATASFKDFPRYFDILGGQFAGHGPVAPFEVRPAAGAGEPFEGFPAFTVTDELYLHEFRGQVRTHFYAEHNGQEVPLVWTRQYGAGRVCYASPGHRTATLGLPAYQAVLRAGLNWVCCL